jgi:hypothetical protein
LYLAHNSPVFLFLARAVTLFWLPLLYTIYHIINHELNWASSTRHSTPGVFDTNEDTTQHNTDKSLADFGYPE